MSEHADQVALFQWAAHAKRGLHPELRLLFAVPNGGQRSKATAGKLKAEGVQAGVPDICLPVPRGPYAACYIELKRMASPGKPAGKETPAQKEWRIALLEAGNYACVCKGWSSARDVLEWYLAHEKPSYEAVGFG
jgi:hypothetical protein